MNINLHGVTSVEVDSTTAHASGGKGEAFYHRRIMVKTDDGNLTIELYGDDAAALILLTEE